MLGKWLADMAGEGVSKTIDSIKKIAIDSWHIDPAKAAELDIEKERIRNDVVKSVETEATKRLELDARDRDSARRREIDTKDSSTPRKLAFVVMGSFIGLSFTQILLLWVFPDVKLQPEGWVLIGNISGYMAAKAEQVVSYYFGSSAGSAAKHRLIERMSDNEE
jgi:hypothetical protein